jgi:hypothetical protein
LTDVVEAGISKDKGTLRAARKRKNHGGNRRQAAGAAVAD